MPYKAMKFRIVRYRAEFSEISMWVDKDACLWGPGSTGWEPFDKVPENERPKSGRLSIDRKHPNYSTMVAMIIAAHIHRNELIAALYEETSKDKWAFAKALEVT